MAVQMTTSSAHDFSGFNLGAETNASSGKFSDAHSFEEALASVSTAERSRPSVSHPANARVASAVSQKLLKALASTKTNPTANDFAGGADMEEIASLLQQNAHASERLKALLAQMMEQAHPDAEIDELLASANLPEVKTGRFDPDAILAEFAPELVCDETTQEPQEAESQTPSLPGVLVPELSYEVSPVSTEGEEAILFDGVPLVDGDAEALPVGKEMPDMPAGEGALQELPIADMAAQSGEVLPAEGGAETVKTDRDVAPDELLPEIAAKGDDVPATEPDALPSETAAAGAKGDSAKTTDADVPRTAGGQSLEELLAQYREERQSRGEPETSNFSRQNAQKDRKTSANATVAKKQQNDESANATSARDARADVSREVPFSSLVNANSREASQTSVVTQNASFARTAAPYVLNGEFAFSDGVNTVLEFMRTDGVSEARIVVEPPALGHIDVSLRASSAGMEATFRVDNEHLKQMLQQQLDILKSSLQMQGIHVSSLAVDIRNKDDQRGREAAYATGKKSRHAGGAGGLDEGMDEGASLVRLDLEKGLLHWVG